jgi:phage baseplate assembly protein W
MVANQTVNTYGQTYFAPDINDIAELTYSNYGLGFPLGKRKKTGGFFSKETGVSLIKNNVQQLLSTERGERVMLPLFGCNLRKYVFQPLTEDLFEAIKDEISFSVSKYIIGAKLIKLSVVPFGVLGPAGGNSLQVTLTLQVTDESLTMFDVEVVVK